MLFLFRILLTVQFRLPSSGSYCAYDLPFIFYPPFQFLPLAPHPPSSSHVSHCHHSSCGSPCLLILLFLTVHSLVISPHYFSLFTFLSLSILLPFHLHLPLFFSAFSVNPSYSFSRHLISSTRSLTRAFLFLSPHICMIMSVALSLTYSLSLSVAVSVPLALSLCLCLSQSILLSLTPSLFLSHFLYISLYLCLSIYVSVSVSLPVWISLSLCLLHVCICLSPLVPVWIPLSRCLVSCMYVSVCPCLSIFVSLCLFLSLHLFFRPRPTFDWLIVCRRCRVLIDGASMSSGYQMPLTDVHSPPWPTQSSRSVLTTIKSPCLSIFLLQACGWKWHLKQLSSIPDQPILYCIYPFIYRHSSMSLSEALPTTALLLCRN